MSVKPRIGLISDHRSPILAGYVQRADYEVALVTPDSLVEGQVAEVDAWVVDCDDSNTVADATIWLEPRLLALSNRPSTDNLEDYRRWCERIIATLDKWTGHIRDSQDDTMVSSPSAYQAVKGTWILVGSTGAFGAMRKFLRAMDDLPPVAFLYAQHINPRQESTLLAMSSANRGIKCTLALGRHWLNVGHVLIAPASRIIRFGNKGEISSAREEWQTPETPNLTQVLLASCGMNPAPAGAIVFSGAGADGRLGLPAIAQLGTRIWAQSPHSCEAPSMPEMAIATGLVTETGTPDELAEKLCSLYR